MKTNCILTTLFLLACFISFGQYPTGVLTALQQTKTNRAELARALDYFYKSKDPLEINAIEFLITNMPAHFSVDYFWADARNRRIDYNELAYPGFTEASRALAQLKNKYGPLHPVSYTYRDIDSIKASLLIDDVELAVARFRKEVKGGVQSNKPDEDFFEYILPYRTSFEPLQNWRRTYVQKFNTLFNEREPIDTQLVRIGQNIRSWFANIYGTEGKDEPLPRLGALQLLGRKKGACEDIADLASFIARSQGYAATIDFVPEWATASGLHYLNYINLRRPSKHHYDAADDLIVDTLAREPSKVLRSTYSIQWQTIAAMLKDTSLIPDNFLRLQNYKDVTREYWLTADVHCKLFRLRNFYPRAAFVSVWNNAKWRPVWFGIKLANDSTTFSNMCKGAVYLPMYYFNRQLVPAGWPVVNGYDRTIVLEPDTVKKRTVFITGQAKYLSFHVGRKYTLYYWRNHWTLIGTKTAESTFAKLRFDNVPSNALYLFMPEYGRGKERPFIITDKGERQWF